ncbi:hypothetical protein FQN60_011291, partial [Etheostoma spectabile]
VYRKQASTRLAVLEEAAEGRTASYQREILHLQRLLRERQEAEERLLQSKRFRGGCIQQREGSRGRVGGGVAGSNQGEPADEGDSFGLRAQCEPPQSGRCSPCLSWLAFLGSSIPSALTTQLWPLFFTSHQSPGLQR